MIVFTQKRRKNSISLVPMIDVLLCLLIFFMLSSQFIRYQSIRLSTVGQSLQNAKNMTSEQAVVLKVENNQYISFSGQRYLLTDLLAQLHAKAAAPKNLPITIQLTQSVNTQALVNIMDALKKSGFQQLHLESEDV